MPRVYPIRYDTPGRRSEGRSPSPLPGRRSRRYDHIPCRVDTGTGNHLASPQARSPLDDRSYFPNGDAVTVRRRGRFDDVPPRVDSANGAWRSPSAHLLGEVVVHPDDFREFERRRLAEGEHDLDLGLSDNDTAPSPRTGSADAASDGPAEGYGDGIPLSLASPPAQHRALSPARTATDTARTVFERDVFGGAWNAVHRAVEASRETVDPLTDAASPQPLVVYHYHFAGAAASSPHAARPVDTATPDAPRSDAGRSVGPVTPQVPTPWAGYSTVEAVFQCGRSPVPTPNLLQMSPPRRRRTSAHP
eukprot:TRINITY_DN21161_c0_g1_i1.p1 TRINITY_DN21161_c0_g1~~TRINITY_DN21161_c0_g1_i1.p1  ORF type:complete len:305 (+),score=28.70 TRINITY_DN21161_c0_g1_i1:90-1004(+)